MAYAKLSDGPVRRWKQDRYLKFLMQTDGVFLLVHYSKHNSVQARGSFATRYTAATQYANMYVRRTRNIAVAFRRPLAENFTLRRTRIGKKTTTKKTFSLQGVCFVYHPIQFWVDCVQFFSI